MAGLRKCMCWLKGWAFRPQHRAAPHLLGDDTTLAYAPQLRGLLRVAPLNIKDDSLAVLEQVVTVHSQTN